MINWRMWWITGEGEDMEPEGAGPSTGDKMTQQNLRRSRGATDWNREDVLIGIIEWGYYTTSWYLCLTTTTTEAEEEEIEEEEETEDEDEDEDDDEEIERKLNI